MSDVTRRQFLSTTAMAGLLATLPSVPASAAGEKIAAPAALSDARPLALGMVLFEGFEVLDVFGPLEMFGMLREKVKITTLAERAGLVRSAAGPSVQADVAFADAGALDILMVPGGMGTRREVANTAFIERFKSLAESTPHVASICTGSAVLARTGLLDGRKATSNKRSYAWATSQGPKVKWVPEARWVEDGKYFSSSGVSAGMDMALGLIEKLFDRATAERIAQGAEYDWHSDKNWDPFAKLNGLHG